MPSAEPNRPSFRGRPRITPPAQDCRLTHGNTCLTIPDVALVDFSDIACVNGYGHLLQSAFMTGDSFSCDTPHPCRQARLISCARQWISGTTSVIDSLPPHDIIAALHYYDIIHRIAFSRPANPEFLSDRYLKILDASIHGDRSISHGDLERIIHDGLSRRDKAYFGKALQWHSLTLDRWLTDCAHFSPSRATRHSAASPGCNTDSHDSRHGAASPGCFPDADNEETLKRITALLRADLFAFMPDQQTFKLSLIQKWLPAIHTLLPTSPSSASAPQSSTTTQSLHLSASGPLLRAALDLLLTTHLTLPPALPSLQPTISTLLKALASAPDLHPYDRAAYTLDAAHRQAARMACQSTMN